MRIFLSFVFLVSGVLVATSGNSALAQAPAVGGVAPPAQGASANATRYKMAVVDVNYIFRNYRRFTVMMDQMRTDSEQVETGLRADRDQVAREEEKLKTYQLGSPEYKRTDEALTQMKANFNVKATKLRKEFLDREAQIYYQAYLEVNDAVKVYAVRNDLAMVLRFNGDPIDPNKQGDVMRAITKPVVYQNSIDITPDILRELDRGVAQRPAGAGTAVRPNVIPGQQR